MSVHGASGYDQCMESEDMVTGGGQWVLDLLDYLIIKYRIPLVSVLHDVHISIYHTTYRV